MATMGKYCKAYLLKDLRAFSGWSEKPGITRSDTVEVDGKKTEQSRPLTDEDYVFVHENLTVAEGVFLDESLIFDAVTPEWEAFCKEQLAFEIPDFEAEHEALLQDAAASGADAAAAGAPAAEPAVPA